MLKLFFRRISGNSCIYLLTLLNLHYAIVHNAFDWLIWLSLFLTIVSVGLAMAAAWKEVSA